MIAKCSATQELDFLRDRHHSMPAFFLQPFIPMALAPLREFLLTGAGFVDILLFEFRECCSQFSLLGNLH